MKKKCEQWNVVKSTKTLRYQFIIILLFVYDFVSFRWIEWIEIARARGKRIWMKQCKQSPVLCYTWAYKMLFVIYFVVWNPMQTVKRNVFAKFLMWWCGRRPKTFRYQTYRRWGMEAKKGPNKVMITRQGSFTIIRYVCIFLSSVCIFHFIRFELLPGKIVHKHLLSFSCGIRRLPDFGLVLRVYRTWMTFTFDA